MNSLQKVCLALRERKSPLLFTAIEGDHIGASAVWDGEEYGDSDIIPASIDENASYPYIDQGILAERIVCRPELVLCGAGHVSVQTAAIAKLCNFSVTVIDERTEFANRDRFPSCDRILNLPFSEGIRSISASNPYYVIVTRGHKNDRECLEEILKHDFTYCGMIGSRRKVDLVFDHLRENGYPEELLSRVYAPIGLKIGANTPEEIAVSIVGQLIQCKYSGLSGVEWDESLIHAIETLSPPYALVTVVNKRGSAPRSTGARMIVTPQGQIISSVGGGFGEYEAFHHAVDLLNDRECSALRYTCKMNNEDASNAGMICGGTIDVLIQAIRN